ncbi:unnamed protein product [Haemonchus placei]|uniref:SER_THR_PHOSPHATASE domain-containing protein n=1 Tax=Haemonchus placei TaxID=6290 RepID=A0A0N4WLV5_HAEPC|nr:unnamed protein product [Haemonchus placei]
MSAGEQDLVSYDLTAGLSSQNISFETFAKNIWSYIMNFYPDGPKPFFKMDIFMTLFNRTAAILEKEPSVLELTGEVTVMGPIYGEGDSLITLLSLVGMPPQKSFVFLGCYFGLGFGLSPLESLMLVFCLKCLHPTKIYLLKGHLEEPASIKSLGLDDWLVRRRIPTDSVSKASDTVIRTVASMPIAAMIGPKILCIPGGPGPIIRENGLAALKACSRMSMNQLDRSMCMEAAWTVMKLEANPVTIDDGIPTFTESQCSAFCKANGLAVIIRGRQLVNDKFLIDKPNQTFFSCNVDEGFLNYPKEVLTIVSAVAYLDNFRNYAAAMTIQGMNASFLFIRPNRQPQNNTIRRRMALEEPRRWSGAGGGRKRTITVKGERCPQKR